MTQMNDMASQIRKPARNPEHAQELRQFMKDTEGNVDALRPLIAELPAYYELLDEFFYELPDEMDAADISESLYNQLFQTELTWPPLFFGIWAAAEPDVSSQPPTNPPLCSTSCTTRGRRDL